MSTSFLFRAPPWRSTHTRSLELATLRYAAGSRPILHRGLATEVAAPSAPRPKMHTAVILNRSPILTRTPTSFERAYYAYQARIQRALHNPFPHDFYFKPGSLLESKFNLEERKRDRKAFGPGFGADHPRAPGAGVTAQDLNKFGRDDDETPAPRVHASDTNGDVKSLDRKGQRNLYLLIQQKKDAAAVWKFPETAVVDNELLHEVCSSRSFAGFPQSCLLFSLRRVI
jgi:large subunit ribosomal protein L46